MSGQKQTATQRLLARAHSAPETQRIHADKIQNKPLLLTPTSKTDLELRNAKDARDRRRIRRDAFQARKRRKPKPLSAKEKRNLHIYDIPAAERKFSIYTKLHALWCDYAREILDVPKVPDNASEEDKIKTERELKTFYTTSAFVGPRLSSADYHGVLLRVVRSRCVERVGTQGIVVRDTKFTFVIITERNELKTIPKEHTIFRFEVPLQGCMTTTDQASKDESKPKLHRLVFELHGDQFENRPADRATKKFKVRIPDDF